MVAAPTKDRNRDRRTHVCPSCAKRFRLAAHNNPNCATCIRKMKEHTI
jgi:predicted amidophosphoribosyltransferase